MKEILVHIRDIADKLFEALRDSVLTQAILVTLIFSSIFWCTVTNQPVPQAVQNWATLILGFYFGSKFNYMIQKGQTK